MSCLFTYAFVAALVCGFVSLMELVDRHAHSADISTLLWNLPAGIYLAINLFVGGAAVYVSSATGVIDFHLGVAEELYVNGILKAIGVGFGGLGILRTNFVTLTNGQRDTSLGLSPVLEKLKEYLDVKINLKQKMDVDKKIGEIMKDVDPDRAKNDLPALCLTGTGCTQQEIDDLKVAIDKVVNPSANLNRFTKGMMMGHALYKLFGIEVLESSVKRLGDVIRIDDSTLKEEQAQEEMLNLSLEEARKKLS